MRNWRSFGGGEEKQTVKISKLSGTRLLRDLLLCCKVWSLSQRQRGVIEGFLRSEAVSYSCFRKLKLTVELRMGWREDKV